MEKNKYLTNEPFIFKGKKPYKSTIIFDVNFRNDLRKEKIKKIFNVLYLL